MEKKYVIELKDNESVYKTIIVNGYPMLQVIVPAPYTEPDLEQVREEAYENGFVAGHLKAEKSGQSFYEDGYQRGYCDALEKHCEICEEKHDAEEAYQQGMNDAWEAARKIGSNSMCSLKEMGFDFSQCVVRDYNPSWFVVKNYSASEAIEKIRQYEQEKKQKEKIKAGDEVIIDSELRGVILDYEELGDYARFSVYTENGLVEECKNISKTGRHFPEIAEVLRKMREEEK